MTFQKSRLGSLAADLEWPGHSASVIAWDSAYCLDIDIVDEREVVFQRAGALHTQPNFLRVLRTFLRVQGLD